MSTSCIGAFQEEHWKNLRNARFIPIPENQENIHFSTPATPSRSTPIPSSQTQKKKIKKQSAEARRAEEEAEKKAAEERQREMEKKLLEEKKNGEKETEKQPEIIYKLMRPNELVLESEVMNQFRSLLDYVPSSYGGKIFLRGCGIPGLLSFKIIIIILNFNYFCYRIS